MAGKLDEVKVEAVAVEAVEVKEVAVEVVKEVRVASTSHFNYAHPTANTIIDSRAVKVPNDSWTQAQIDAGYIVVAE